MKFRTLYSRLLLLLVPFLFTGCYTQFHTFDQYPLTERSYNDYDRYGSADEQERMSESEVTDLEMELALEEMGIYFQDYETKRWYIENYANKLFWEGYNEGYDDGYFDGWANSGYFPYSARYNMNRHRYFPGYTGAFAYYDFYHYPGFYSQFRYQYGRHHRVGFYAGYYNNWGYYSPYYHNNYWGGYGYYNYHVAYNNYYRNTKYRRDADLYKKGPRNSGLVNRGEYRTRSSNGLDRDKNTTGLRSRTTGVTRTRSVNTGSRVRGTTGSSVGKTRSTGSSRSRGSGSSVGKRSSSGNSGKSRSRGNDSYSSNFGQTSVRDINVSQIRSRTYTIPSERISRPTVNSRSSRSSFFDIFKSGSFSDSRYRSTSSVFNNRTRSVNSSRSSTNRSSGVTRSSSSRSSSKSSKVSRSSSSSKSSGSRSRGSSSSSKRSRGGN